MRKALDSAADVVILDLEDAVSPAHKDQARAEVFTLLHRLTAGGVRRAVQVRVNDVRGETGRTDLAVLAACAEAARRAREEAAAGGGAPGEPVEGEAAGGEAGDGGRPWFEVRLPKVESAAQVQEVADRLPGVRLHPLLESAIGIERAYEIASASPAVASIALGEADLSAELGVSDDAGLLYARSRIVVAARAAGLPAPAQSVYPRVRDLDGLRDSCLEGRRLGFLGRTAIHPAQLPVIAEAYRPTPEEIARAREIVEAAARAEETGTGALALPDGRFVDIAIVRAAERTLALAPPT
ncbi:CoA ester lyase [Bailinhaonella thermotolerans]|uniref:CoA ester lyase n=2 Tax=Bailinhaonella thermotolerans TaxID=1070861 RepID=A0A3A4AP11_9ACTN|nr:CoA ester lyase [Bailinhaonella thermotolerans]